MRAVATVALAALAVTAGCAGLLPGEEASTTREPIVRGSPSPPPGVDAQGVTNLSALLSAHRRALVERGFVLATTTTVRRPGGPNRTTSRRVVAARSLAAHRHRVVRRFGGRMVVLQRFADGTTAARRVLENGTVAGSGAYRGADARTLTRTPRLRWFLRRAALEVTGVTVGRTGTRYFLSADGPLEAGEGHRSVRLVVAGDGAIESLVATVTRPAPDRRAGVRVETYRYRLVETGAVTVERPDWTREVASG